MITGIFVVEIVVQDFKAACSWYKKILGLTPAGMLDEPSGLWCKLLLQNGADSGLALWQPSSFPKLPSEKFFSFFIPLLGVEDLSSLVDQLRANGVNVMEYAERETYSIATIVDLEGNTLQLYEVKK